MGRDSAIPDSPAGSEMADLKAPVIHGRYLPSIEIYSCQKWSVYWKGRDLQVGLSTLLVNHLCGNSDLLRNKPKQEVGPGKVTLKRNGWGMLCDRWFTCYRYLVSHRQPMFSFTGSGKLAPSSLARFQNGDGEPTTVKKAVIQGKNKILHEKGSECY